MSEQSSYSRFHSFIAEFIRRHPEGAAVDGATYDLPGTTVYTSYTQRLPERGRLEVNVVTPAAAATFEWSHEITLSDKVGGRFIHLILRPNQTADETYGKTVLPINQARAEEIFDSLTQAAVTT